MALKIIVFIIIILNPSKPSRIWERIRLHEFSFCLLWTVKLCVDKTPLHVKAEALKDLLVYISQNSHVFSRLTSSNMV